MYFPTSWCSNYSSKSELTINQSCIVSTVTCRSHNFLTCILEVLQRKQKSKSHFWFRSLSCIWSYHHKFINISLGDPDFNISLSLICRLIRYFSCFPSWTGKDASWAFFFKSISFISLLKLYCFISIMAMFLWRSYVIHSSKTVIRS